MDRARSHVYDCISIAFWHKSDLCRLNIPVMTFKSVAIYINTFFTEFYHCNNCIKIVTQRAKHLTLKTCISKRISATYNNSITPGARQILSVAILTFKVSCWFSIPVLILDFVIQTDHCIHFVLSLATPDFCHQSYIVILLLECIMWFLLYTYLIFFF